MYNWWAFTLLSPVQSPISGSAYEFSPSPPFLFLGPHFGIPFLFLSLSVIQSYIPPNFLLIAQLYFFLLLFIFTPPKSHLPQPNSALQQSKWGWNCCVYSSEFVKIRMWRFHTIYWKYIGHIERSRKDWQLKLILTLHAIFLGLPSSTAFLIKTINATGMEINRDVTRSPGWARSQQHRVTWKARIWI